MFYALENDFMIFDTHLVDGDHTGRGKIKKLLHLEMKLMNFYSLPSYMNSYKHTKKNLI